MKDNRAWEYFSSNKVIPIELLAENSWQMGSVDHRNSGKLIHKDHFKRLLSLIS